MRNSSILKLAKKNNKLTNGTKNAGGGSGKEEKKWLHAPETLLASHVVYLVKVSGDGVAADAYGMALVTNNECGSGQVVPAHGDFNIRIFSSSAAQKWTSRRASTW